MHERQMWRIQQHRGVVVRVLKRLIGFRILKSFVGFACVLEGFGCGVGVVLVPLCLPL